MANRDPSEGREPSGQLNDHGLAQQLKQLFRTDSNDDVLSAVQMLHSESDRYGQHTQQPDAAQQQGGVTGREAMGHGEERGQTQRRSSRQ
jgi:hypothetical protein